MKKILPTTLITLTVALAVAWFAGGCAELEGPLDVGSGQEPIIGGELHAGDPEAPLLIFQRTDGGTATCSGILISPRVILTAAHCLVLQPAEEVDSVLAYFGSDATVATVEDDPAGLALIEVTKGVSHSLFSLDNLAGGNDIAMVLLDSPAPVAPREINREPLDPYLGDPMRLVSWGATSVDAEGNGSGAGVKQQGYSNLQEVQPLLFRFGSAVTNTCRGDSGGPQFMFINGSEVVVGVNSYGDTTCSMYSYSTRVDAYAANFIDPWVRDNDPPTCAADFRCVPNCQDPDCDSGEDFGDDYGDDGEDGEDGAGEGGGEGDGGEGDGEGGENGGGENGGGTSGSVSAGCSAAGGANAPWAALLLVAALLLGRRRQRSRTIRARG